MLTKLVGGHALRVTDSQVPTKALQLGHEGPSQSGPHCLLTVLFCFVFFTSFGSALIHTGLFLVPSYFLALCWMSFYTPCVCCGAKQILS